MAELERLKALGELHDSSQVCEEGTQAWQRLSDVLANTPAPDPPQEQTEELIPGWNHPGYTNCIGGGY